MKKQIISSVLCAAMCLTAVPSAAYAAFAPDITEGISIEANVGAADHIDVQLTDKIYAIYGGEYNALTIIGSGEYNLTGADYCKCTSNWNHDIKRIAIGNESYDDVFTSVAPYSFTRMDVEEITLSGTITDINDCAFYQLPELKRVGLPYKLQRIGKQAFSHAVSLDYVKIPDSVVEIGDEAFFYCINLSKVVMSTGVTKIPYFCFNSCPLEYFEFPPELVEVGEGAFRYTKLEEVELPSKVTTIGLGAFQSINELKTVTIPSSAKKIDLNAFDSPNVEDVYIYSKDCAIYESEGTLGRPATAKSSGTLIHCYANSTAHKYAMKYGYRFELMDKPTDLVYGDANLDGKVTLGDALAVSQYIANEEKYGLSETAKKNADCYNPGDGITGNDASAIQRLISGDIEELPYIAKDQD